MKFDDLDKKMRFFETAADLCVLPGMFMVARLDGRSFTWLTKESCQFEAPFDERFRDLMVATAESLSSRGTERRRGRIADPDGCRPARSHAASSGIGWRCRSFREQEYERLRTELEDAFEQSNLPEQPSGAAALDD